MKKRSMILALASMLGISAAATAVSGFAWFTSQTTAAITGGNYKVGAYAGNLVIESTEHDINCTATGNTEKNAITVANSSTFADVTSTDGKQFYKLYNINNTTADVKDEGDLDTKPANGKWMSEVNTKQTVAVSWEISVENTGDAPMNVYLSNDSTDHKIFSANVAADGAESYVNAYRLAIFDDTDTLVYFYSQTRNGFSKTNLNNKTSYTIGSDTNLEGDKLPTATKNATDAFKIESASELTALKTKQTGADADAVADSSSQLLIEGLGSQTRASATLKFVVWCEGADTPEAPVDQNNGVKLSLGLSGLVIA